MEKVFGSKYHIYEDITQRRHFAVMFNRVSQKLIDKSKIANNLEKVINMKKVINYLLGKKDLNEKILLLTGTMFEFYDYIVDDFIIIGAYENFIKGKLIEMGHVPFKVKISYKSLFNRQKRTPIHIDEIKEELGEDIADHLQDYTLGASVLLKESYFKITDLCSDTRLQLHEANQRRNKIHFDTGAIVGLELEFLYAIQDLANKISDSPKEYS